MRLEYTISAVNDAQVKRLLRSIEAEAVRSAKRSQLEKQKAERESARAAVKAAKDAERAAAAQARAQEKIERQKIARQNASFAMAQRLRDKEEREHIATEKRKARETERAAKQAARAEEIATKKAAKAKEKAAREAHAAREKLAGRITGGIARSVGGTARGLATVGGSVLGLAGGFAIGNAIGEDVRIRAKASQLANQAGKPELKGQLAAESRNIAGFTGEEALAGLDAFVSVTGDLEAGLAMLGSMGELALATGANFEDMAAAAGNAFIPIADQIKDPTKRLEALNEVLRRTAGMGNIGAVEMKDLSKEMAGLAAVSNSFQGSADRNVSAMVALAQAARKRGGASNAAEAVTAVSSFASDLTTTTSQKRLKKMGVDVFTDKTHTQLKAPEQILGDVLEATGGDLTKIGSIFGKQGVKAFKGFSPVFAEAERNKPGSGREAVMKEFQHFMDAALSEKQIKERAKSRLDDADMKFKEVAKEFNLAVSQDLLPVLVKVIPKFAELIPIIADVVEDGAKLASWFAENPIKGIGALILGSIAKDLAGVAIGEALKTKLTSAIPAGGPTISPAKLMVTAGAVTVAALAFNQVDKGADELRKQTGGLVDLHALLPGFKDGKFSFDNLAEEIGIGKISEKLSKGDFLGAAGETIGAATGANSWKKRAEELAKLIQVIKDPEIVDREMDVQAKERSKKRDQERADKAIEKMAPIWKEAAEAAKRAAEAQERAAKQGGDSKRTDPIVKRTGA